MSEMDDEKTSFKVVRNDEDQYSIWPADRENPAGWHEEGTTGTRAECLSHIEEVWTDLRPRSVRERMAAQAG
jgi:MbtH protein